MHHCSDATLSFYIKIEQPLRKVEAQREITRFANSKALHCARYGFNTARSAIITPNKISIFNLRFT
jgi:hypothetical protein